jgi:hypothetical protein
MELQKVRIWADGRTEPPIGSGTEILLIQGGKVEVGRFVLEADEYSDFFIEHPNNAEELIPDALAFVNQELLKTDVSIIAICPRSIADKMRWHSN